MSSTLLGTDYLQSISSPHPSTSTKSTTSLTTTTTTSPNADLTPTICQNLSAFKNYLKISRSLDDSIILRFNRAEALLKSTSPSPSSTYSSINSNPLVPSKNCQEFWIDLVGLWNERNLSLNYCDQVIAGQAKLERRKGRGLGEEIGLDRNRSVLGRGESEEVVKRRAIHREIQVENIIRSRSLYLFQSRCPSHNLLPKPDDLPIPNMDESLVGEARKEGGRGGKDGKGGVRWNG